MCMNFTLTNGDIALLSVIGVLTVPLWIVPAIGYGVVAGVGHVSSQMDADKWAKNHLGEFVNKTDEWWQARKAVLQPILDACEKNPTVATLTQLGVAFYEQEDIASARGHLRRAVDLARAQKETNTLLYALCAFSYGLVLMRWQMWQDALDMFQEAHALVEAFAAAAAPHTTSSSPQGASASAGGVSLNKSVLLNKVGFSRLNVALYCLSGGGYSPDDYMAPTEERVKMIDQAVDELQQALELDLQQSSPGGAGSPSSTPDFRLHACIAKYYQLTSRNYNYTKLEANFADKAAKLIALFGQVAGDEKASRALRGTAASYTAQIYFLLGDYKQADAAIQFGRKCVDDQFFIVGDVEQVTGLSNNAGEDDEQKKFLFERLAHGAWDCVREEATCGTQLHGWEQRSFHRPSWCRACNKFISLSENKTAWFCSSCDFRAHAACYERIKDSSMCPQRSAADKSTHISTSCASASTSTNRRSANCAKSTYST